MPDPIDTRVAPRGRDDQEYDAHPPLPAEALAIKIDDESLAALYERLPSAPILAPKAFEASQPPSRDECAGARPTFVRASELPKHASLSATEIARQTGADAALLESSRQRICAETGTDPFTFADRNEANREWRRAPEMTEEERLRATMRMIGSMAENPFAAAAYLYARANDETIANQEATVAVADAAWGIAAGIGAARMAKAEPTLAPQPPTPPEPDVPLKAVNGRRPMNGKLQWASYSSEKLPEKIRMKYPTSVRFKATGFADFDPVSTAKVRLPNLTGGATDKRRASVAAGFAPVARPLPGHTWHHHEDGETMLLVPTDLHRSIRHTGGAAKLRARDEEGTSK